MSCSSKGCPIRVTDLGWGPKSSHFLVRDVSFALDAGDRLAEALAGKPILLTATGGGQKKAHVSEHQLRPLFGFFEAISLPTGVYAFGADFVDGQPVSPVLTARLDRAVAQFGPFLTRARVATAA